MGVELSYGAVRGSARIFAEIQHSAGCTTALNVSESDFDQIPASDGIELRYEQARGICERFLSRDEGNVGSDVAMRSKDGRGRGRHYRQVAKCEFLKGVGRASCQAGPKRFELRCVARH